MHKPWLAQYPAGVGADIDVSRYDSLVALLNDAFSRFAERPALRFLGASITFAQVDEASSAFAAYLARGGESWRSRGDHAAQPAPAGRGGRGGAACGRGGGQPRRAA